MDLKNRILLLLTAISVAIGCRVAMASTKPPESRMAKCVASARVWDITFKHELASFMGVSLDRVPAIFCQRIIEGVRTGRISFSDVNAIQLDQPTEIWLVIKGKSKAAAAATPPPRNPRFRTCSNVITGSFEVSASEKCPLGGSYSQAAGVPTVIEGKSKAVTPARRNPKFRTCSNVYSGTFEIPASRKCPSGGG
ncbi:hypothetical protein [Mesorhizobium sp. M2A.F.Ca.ET.043.05.1.1]|uniref:hypothetical protein n=1 Tax=Mesorhizobium sp. M2A.F.Ca.ET.043.05.1.1 TaxID=2493671 RepID=UPI001677036B|nr:hypothetical protein [Mesorhizobium sp. M2A.F.Ca.ET.043.05.1.1]